VPSAGLRQTTPAALARPAAPWGWSLGPAAARRPTDRRTDQGAGCRRPLGRTGQPDPAYRRGAPAAVLPVAPLPCRQLPPPVPLVICRTNDMIRAPSTGSLG